MKSGIIFDIKEFAVFDGPSVRQTIFLKGCPLRCNWCHNPEGLTIEPQLLISSNGCMQCGNCDEEFKKNILNCPKGLKKIVGKRYTSKELSDVIQTNTGYYAKYGGGVTFSGGEPLMQGDFLLEVIDQLPNVHKAIQTAGYADSLMFTKIINKVDYVFMDIKHGDSEMHMLHTGVDNRLILENLEILKKSGLPFIIRIPMIPGVNDTKENYETVCGLIKGANNLQKVELLPYHNAAGAKYKSIGMEYSPKFDTQRLAKANTQIFIDHGMECSVL